MKQTIMAWTAAAFGVVTLGACTAATNEPSTQTTKQPVALTAADGSGAPLDRPHPGPPPEAFTACESKAVGDACSVTFDGNSVAGHCSSPPPGVSDTRISCRPDNLPDHPPGGHRAPPPEVFDACTGKAADAACNVTLGDHTFSGTCHAPPPGVDETRLGCMPARMPH